ncbi:MAG: 7-cyano-7-deazaguanine synthase QueC [Phycisphaerae bacterium]|nr:7-cyano-7-deazaguanine synthase QueC [Phycisphaerae bacterium]
MGIKKTEGKCDARPSAVVLLSGGLDSAVTLAVAVREGFACEALTFVYGQRHGREVESARRVARQVGARHHRVVSLDPSLFAGSALTGGPAVPLDRPEERMASEIPCTYVPARNTVFLALALAYAEARGAFDIFIGANAVDYSGYPDCRPAFIEAFERLANLGTRSGVTGEGRFRVRAPLMAKSKAQIVRMAVELGVDASITWSCYNPDDRGRPCGRCDSCRIRLRAFAEAGLTDPLCGDEGEV